MKTFKKILPQHIQRQAEREHNTEGDQENIQNIENQRDTENIEIYMNAHKTRCSNDRWRGLLEPNTNELNYTIGPN